MRPESLERLPDQRKPGGAIAIRIAKTVFWSFFGIRKNKDYEADQMTLMPHQVILGGIIGAAMVVMVLILLVRLVTR
jgi:hypothetical protein